MTAEKMKTQGRRRILTLTGQRNAQIIRKTVRGNKKDDRFLLGFTNIAYICKIKKVIE